MTIPLWSAYFFVRMSSRIRTTVPTGGIGNPITTRGGECRDALQDRSGLAATSLAGKGEIRRTRN